MEDNSLLERLWSMFRDFADRAGRLGMVGTVENLLHADEHSIDLAYTVLLVDVACIDNDFSPRESYFIKQALKEHLGVSYDQAVDLVEEATKLVESDEDVESFGAYLRDHLSLARRKELSKVLDVLIDEDRVDHPFEEHLRGRYLSLLGFHEEEE